MGTSTSDYGQGERDMDHPHAYGDKSTCKGTQRKCQGSSPRVWGQGAASDIGVAIVRIIPTRMGTSFYQLFFFCNGKDHPHAYGDKW